MAPEPAAGEPERERRLATVDRVCALVLERAAPLRFVEVATPRRRRDLFELRYRVSLEQGWASPAEFPDGLERDGYDDDAIQLGGFDGARLIAGARLVLPREGRPLPTESAFELEVAPRLRVVDLGRLVVERSYRGGSLPLLTGVLACAWQAIRRRDLSRFCGADTPAMIRLYRGLGFTVDVLAPARTYWREQRHPVTFDLASSAEALMKRLRTQPDQSTSRCRTTPRIGSAIVNA